MRHALTQACLSEAANLAYADPVSYPELITTRLEEICFVTFTTSRAASRLVHRGHAGCPLRKGLAMHGRRESR